MIARAANMSFWQEFWFEYLVGSLFGWLVFQLKSMTTMTDRVGEAIAMAFRAEFFSMLTVMGGMGAVMAYVTPMVVGAQPKPLTWAFWGFGMLGLLVGFAFRYPMNWMLVKVGWKHGMGGKEGARPVQERSQRVALVTAMFALGLIALAFPAWLVEVRQRAPVEPPGSPHAALVPRSDATGGDEMGEPVAANGGQARIALGGARDVWGFVDIGPSTFVDVPAEALVPGPARVLGPRWVAYPRAAGAAAASAAVRTRGRHRRRRGPSEGRGAGTRRCGGSCRARSSSRDRRRAARRAVACTALRRAAGSRA